MFALLDQWNQMWNGEAKTKVLCKGVLVTKGEEVPGGGTGDWVCSQQGGHTECGFRNLSFFKESV